jgi:type I restriction enzyme S subunit
MNLLLLRTDHSLSLPRFLHYLCNYYRFSGRFVAIAQHAVNQSSINQTKLKQVPIPLAPLPEQRRIVAEIETQFTRLDAGVAALERVRANLRRYKAAVLKTACEGRLVPTEAGLARAEGRAYEPADRLLARSLAERRAKWEAEHLGKKYKEPALSDTESLPALSGAEGVKCRPHVYHP